MVNYDDLDGRKEHDKILRLRQEFRQDMERLKLFKDANTAHLEIYHRPGDSDTPGSSDYVYREIEIREIERKHPLP